MHKLTLSSGENVPWSSFRFRYLRYTLPWRWQSLGHNAYKYTLDYEAGGISLTLFDDLELKFELDPRQVTFVI